MLQGLKAHTIYEGVNTERETNTTCRLKDSQEQSLMTQSFQVCDWRSFPDYSLLSSQRLKNSQTYSTLWLKETSEGPDRTNFTGQIKHFKDTWLISSLAQARKSGLLIYHQTDRQSLVITSTLFLVIRQSRSNTKKSKLHNSY